MSMQQLQKSGFMVFRDVISGEKCKLFREEALKESKTMEDLSHTTTMWKLRSEVTIRNVFSSLWDTDDLCTSFDGMTVHGCDGEGFNLPFHVDQQIDTGKCICVQGYLALTSSGKNNGGTILIPESHKYFQSCLHRNGKSRSTDQKAVWQYFEVQECDEIFRLCPDAVMPELEAGDMLLWDSRLVHRVHCPAERSEQRVIAYLSMVPRSFLSKSTLKRRRRAFREGISSTHWPQHFVKKSVCTPPRMETHPLI